MSYDTAKSKKCGDFCTDMVDFCRPGHIMSAELIDKLSLHMICMHMPYSQLVTLTVRFDPLVGIITMYCALIFLFLFQVGDHHKPESATCVYMCLDYLSTGYSTL